MPKMRFLSAPADPLAGFNGPTSKRRRDGTGGAESRGEGRERNGREKDRGV